MTTPDGKDMNVLSETLEKVKKGIEYCSKNVLDPCNGCPYERIGDDEWKCGLNADALFCIKQLEAQVPKWISVEGNPPDVTEDAIAYNAYGEMMIGKIFETSNGKHKCEDGYSEDMLNVTHWMPLPKAPKEERT